jgi:hypothetical protein
VSDSTYETYRQAQSFYNFLYLVVIVVLWLWKVNSYIGGSPGFEAIKAMERALPPALSVLQGDATVSVFGFLIISNIRLFLGGAYCNRDNSFTEALQLQEGGNTRVLLMYAVVELLSIVTLMRSSVVSVSCAWVVPAFVFSEALIILSFDWRFRDVYSRDKGYRFNIICIANDVVFTLLAVVWLLFACRWMGPSKLAQYWGTGMWVFGFIALVEVGLVYRESFRQSLKDTCVALKSGLP